MLKIMIVGSRKKLLRANILWHNVVTQKYSVGTEEETATQDLRSFLLTGARSCVDGTK
jgi:hypothetical protein